MKKNYIIPATIALLALGSLAPPVNAGTAQPVQSSPHLDRAIKTYNERLSIYPSELKSLRVAPNRGRVAYALPKVAAGSPFFHPHKRDDAQALEMCTIEQKYYSPYDAYASAQEDLLDALVMTRYESEQQQEAVWQRTLAENEALKASYPLPAQKLTDRVALVEELWRREQARPQAERDESYAAARKESEECANKQGVLLFHQHSPAMQELLLRYLCLSLETEIQYYAHAGDISLDHAFWQSWSDNLKRIKTLDASKLDDMQHAFLLVMIEYSEQRIAAALEKTAEGESMKPCFQELDEEYSDALKDNLWDRGAILFSVLDHFDLFDYYKYRLAQEMAKYVGDTEARVRCDVKLHIIAALKKVIAEQTAQ